MSTYGLAVFPLCHDIVFLPVVLIVRVLPALAMTPSLRLIV
jgi:hypothetical protein